jgi:hypothetical protein
MADEPWHAECRVCDGRGWVQRDAAVTAFHARRRANASGPTTGVRPAGQGPDRQLPEELQPLAQHDGAFAKKLTFISSSAKPPHHHELLHLEAESCGDLANP